MLHEPPTPNTLLYGIHRDRSEVYREGHLRDIEKEVRVVRPVHVVNVWCKITAEACEWWVGDGKGNIYEPQDLFMTKAEAEASLKEGT
jgi:hypothetical protein